LAKKLYDEIHAEQKLYNKFYNMKEAYLTLYKGLRTLKYMRKGI